MGKAVRVKIIIHDHGVDSMLSLYDCPQQTVPRTMLLGGAAHGPAPSLG